MITQVVRKRSFHRAGTVLLDGCAADGSGVIAQLDRPRDIQRRFRLLRSYADADTLSTVGVIEDIHNDSTVRAEGRHVADAVEA
jgi:hypothetical protein